MLSMFAECEAALGSWHVIADVLSSAARQHIQQLSTRAPKSEPLYSEIAWSPGLARILAAIVFSSALIASAFTGRVKSEDREFWTGLLRLERTCGKQTIAQAIYFHSATQRIMNSLPIISFILSIIFSATWATAQGAGSPQAEVAQQVDPYLQPQRPVHIEGGRAINLVCLGQGSPTVVLTAGMGGWSQVWYRIQSPLSRRTRFCAWDPAGLGFSTSSPEPQDTVHKSEDLERALQAGQIDGPYVMVAHSAGAYVAVQFTDQHQSAVVGMVLVDPSIPDQDAVRERVAPKFAAYGGAAPNADATRLRQCAADLRQGKLKQGTPRFDECTSEPLPSEFSALTVKLASLNTDPDRLLTQASAIENGPRSGREVINPQRRYGKMPLIVLTAGRHPIPPGVPAEVSDQAALFFRVLASGHHAYAALSTRGRDQVIPDSMHFIQLEKPAAVIDAIRHVLADTKTQAPN